MQIVIPKEGKTLKCAECDIEVTRTEAMQDTMRIYERHGRYLCELCAEEECENENEGNTV